MPNYLIKNTTIVNEGRRFVGDVLIKDGRIEKIASKIDANFAVEEIDGTGQFLLPGAIDDQVHFREPGLTHKANIYTEAKAAVAGGTTSFMEMPNTNPPVFTQELLEDKYQIAAANALANYSFFMGTSQDNVEEILKTNAKKNEVCGVKIFMGSSTGNLLVDNPIVLERIFEGSELLIATHCEEEAIIKQNNIKVITVAEIRKKGVMHAVRQTLLHLSNCDQIYLSFDVDSLDSAISRGTGTPVINGLKEREAEDLVATLMQNHKICCLEITEVNPTLDKENLMAEIAFNILQRSVNQLLMN